MTNQTTKSHVLEADLKIERLPGKAEGRSAGSAVGPFVFIATVAHDRKAVFDDQVLDAFSRLEQQLEALGSSKLSLLSVTVYLADMAMKKRFDELWIIWIGADQNHWPQRACVAVTLAETTLVEIVTLALRGNA